MIKFNAYCATLGLDGKGPTPKFCCKVHLGWRDLCSFSLRSGKQDVCFVTAAENVVLNSSAMIVKYGNNM